MARATRGRVEATVEIKGLRPFIKDIRQAEKDVAKVTREGLKEAGEPVRDEWRRTFAPIHERSASKLRIRVGAKGVFVDQPLRKTTGERPDFAALQQKYGEAALDRKADDAERILEHNFDDLADDIEGKV